MILLFFSLYSHITDFIPDTLLLKSIVMLESQEKPKAIHRNKNGTTDYGLGQINTIWVKSLNLDTLKLLDDPEYNVYWSAYILRNCLDEYGWTWAGLSHYHNGNPIYGLSYMLRVKEIYNGLIVESNNHRDYSNRHGIVLRSSGRRIFKNKNQSIRIISNNRR
jgi:hypothetical protein